MTKKAKQSFAKGAKDGSITVVNEDDLFADDHPFVKAWPDMFVDVEDLAQRPPSKVEQATAAPGERRTTKR